MKFAVAVWINADLTLQRAFHVAVKRLLARLEAIARADEARIFPNKAACLTGLRGSPGRRGYLNYLICCAAVVTG
jgi:hypothetical protein